MNIRQTEITALKFVGQARMVYPKTVKDRRIEIVNMDRITGDVIAEVVRLPDRHARLDAATREPNGETARMVIAPIIVIC